MLGILLKPFQWVFSLLLTLFILLLLALALAGFYVPFLIEKYVSHKTDFPTSISNHHLNVFLGEVDFWNTTIENPARFHEPLLANIGELSCHLKPFSLLTEKAYFERLVLDIRSISWVKTATGEVNIDTFLDSLSPSDAPSAQSPSSSIKTPLVPYHWKQFHIDTLIIRIGTLQRIDYTGGVAKASRYNLGINLELHNVESIADIMGPLSATLTKAGVVFFTDALLNSLLFGNIGNMPGNILPKLFPGEATGGEKAVKEMGKDVQDALKSGLKQINSIL